MAVSNTMLVLLAFLRNLRELVIITNFVVLLERSAIPVFNTSSPYILAAFLLDMATCVLSFSLRSIFAAIAVLA